MKIAIVGAGISGLGAAHLLNPYHDITVFEKNDYIGGHSRTINIQEGDMSIPVDTGFIVYNERNYPHLIAMFAHLGVNVEKSDMSFGASIANGWLEYSSSSIFAQKKNILNFRFWGMIKDILTFNKNALSILRDDNDITLGQCLEKMKLGAWFKEYYILAMGAAIWSCSVDTIMKFPARTFIKFFDNHGLLSVRNQPQWYTVRGGSKEYVRKLTQSFVDKIKTKSAVSGVERVLDGVLVHTTHGDTQKFDNVIMACHANQSLAMIKNLDENEKQILGSFSYQSNAIYVHSDESFMPRNKNAWSSWVYLSEHHHDNKSVVSLTYWMNNLQNIKSQKPILVTLNPGRIPDPALTYDQHNFSHPIFDIGAIEAQKKIASIQGQGGIYYCGAYQQYGFHEDGLLSAVRVADYLGIQPPWK